MIKPLILGFLTSDIAYFKYCIHYQNHEYRHLAKDKPR